MTTRTKEPMARKKRELTDDEREKVREALRSITPWDGHATRTDKALLWTMLGITVFSFATLPFKPWLIAHHPVALELLGGNAVIGAAAAFARIGQASLGTVLLFGLIGSMKFDWLFWWMGRRWGSKIVRMFTPNPTLQERIDRADELPGWVAPVAVLAAVLPGVPAAVALSFAGWRRMGLGLFFLLNALSTLAWVGLIAGLGYWAGQHAVDVVLTIDKYALWVTFAAVFVMAFWGARRTPRTPAGR